jgi:hypothetical protein
MFLLFLSSTFDGSFEFAFLDFFPTSHQSQRERFCLELGENSRKNMQTGIVVKQVENLKNYEFNYQEIE